MRYLLALLALISATAFAQGTVSSTCIWSGTVADCLPADGLLLRNQRDLRLGEASANGSNYVAIQAPSTLAADVTLTVPPDDGDANELLRTDGSGVLTWELITNSNVDAAAAIDGSKIVSATGSVPGVVTTGTQTFAGDKTINGNLSATGYLATGTLRLVATTIGSGTACNTACAGLSPISVCIMGMQTSDNSKRECTDTGATKLCLCMNDGT